MINDKKAQGNTTKKGNKKIATKKWREKQTIKSVEKGSKKGNKGEKKTIECLRKSKEQRYKKENKKKHQKQKQTKMSQNNLQQIESKKSGIKDGKKRLKNSTTKYKKAIKTT